MGRAERQAELGEHLKNSQKEGFPAGSQRRNFGEAQSILLLNFRGRGAVGGIYVQLGMQASSLNLPFENAKCVYPVNNLRKNIHLKEDIH